MVSEHEAVTKLDVFVIGCGKNKTEPNILRFRARDFEFRNSLYMENGGKITPVHSNRQCVILHVAARLFRSAGVRSCVANSP